jgi:alkylhydroperoxidase family enzyme
MARITGVAPKDAGLSVKLAYWYMRRAMKQMTGSEPAHGTGIEPIEIWAHQPKMLSGMGKMEGAVRKGNSLDDRLKYLVEAKGASMIGCEYCLDLGSAVCRNSGLADEELLDLLRYRESKRFSEREKAALDYTVAVMRTPVEVSDELFARLQEHFSDEQLVELTALLTIVNHHRFNAAFGIEAAGFSEGSVCMVPEPAQAQYRLLSLNPPWDGRYSVRR